MAEGIVCASAAAAGASTAAARRQRVRRFISILGILIADVSLVPPHYIILRRTAGTKKARPARRRALLTLLRLSVRVYLRRRRFENPRAAIENIPSVVGSGTADPMIAGS